jgi:hypothetical protein
MISEMFGILSGVFGGRDAVVLGVVPAPEKIDHSLFLFFSRVSHKIVRHGSRFLPPIGMDEAGAPRH